MAHSGAAPNARRLWPQVGTGASTEAFNGCHLATLPEVLRGTPPAPWRAAQA